MISEELHKIKSFGSDRKSAVTEGDISQKEAELGFCLPAALRELYLRFRPDDPAFSEKGKFIRPWRGRLWGCMIARSAPSGLSQGTRPRRRGWKRCLDFHLRIDIFPSIRSFWVL